MGEEGSGVVIELDMTGTYIAALLGGGTTWYYKVYDESKLDYLLESFKLLGIPVIRVTK